MAEIDRETCRKAAAECVELARVTADPAKKEILLIRAQEWIKLAYSRSEDEFDRHLAQLNSSQMEGHGPAPVQRQPMQQQQARTTENEK
jgi:hypothetical protein